MTERTTPEQAASIREPLNAVNRRWENLLRGMVERQKQLEHALLHLGQFQHALNELLVWINKTDNTLDQLKPVCTHLFMHFSLLILKIFHYVGVIFFLLSQHF